MMFRLMQLMYHIDLRIFQCRWRWFCNRLEDLMERIDPDVTL